MKKLKFPCKKFLYLLIFLGGFLKAQYFLEEAQKEYSLLLEYEKALEAQEEPLLFRQQREAFVQASRSFLQRYAPFPLSQNVRLSLFQYSENPEEIQNLFWEIWKEPTPREKALVLLFKKEFFFPQIHSKMQFVLKAEELLTSPYLRLLYLQYLYESQHYQRLLECATPFSADFREEEEALCILSLYSLGQGEKAQVILKGFCKTFPQSPYLDFFGRREEFYAPCQREIPPLIGEEEGGKAFSLKNYVGNVFFVYLDATMSGLGVSENLFKECERLQEKYPEVIWIRVFLSEEEKAQGSSSSLMKPLSGKWLSVFPLWASQRLFQKAFPQYPCLFLVDTQGRICFIFEKGDFLEQALQGLLEAGVFFKK
jgi:hypothetical protein